MNIIGIICAIRPEAKPIVEMLGLTLLETSPFPIYQGEHNGKIYYLSICGLGKACAAASTQSLIDRFSVVEIFNVEVSALTLGTINLWSTSVLSTVYLNVTKVPS